MSEEQRHGGRVETRTASACGYAERSAARHQRKVAVGVGPHRQWKKVGGCPCGGVAASSGEAGRRLLRARPRSEYRRGLGLGDSPAAAEALSGCDGAATRRGTRLRL